MVRTRRKNIGRKIVSGRKFTKLEKEEIQGDLYLKSEHKVENVIMNKNQIYFYVCLVIKMYPHMNLLDPCRIRSVDNLIVVYSMTGRRFQFSAKTKKYFILYYKFDTRNLIHFRL